QLLPRLRHVELHHDKSAFVLRCLYAPAFPLFLRFFSIFPTKSGKSAPLFSITSALFFALYKRVKRHLYCFQPLPHSLPKYPGVGALSPKFPRSQSGRPFFPVTEHGSPNYFGHRPRPTRGI